MATFSVDYDTGFDSPPRSPFDGAFNPAFDSLLYWITVDMTTPLPGDFTPVDFNADFSTPADSDTLTMYNHADRPKPPKYSRLWSRFQYPVTPAGLFLWKTGQVIPTATWHSDMFLSADDRILGGHRWYALSSSWQAQVLTDAGYPLTRYEGPFA